MAEQLICNQQVDGSTPFTSSNRLRFFEADNIGSVPEWPKGADCKSVVSDFGGPNPPAPTRKKHALACFFLCRVPLAHDGKHRAIAIKGGNIIFRKIKKYHKRICADVREHNRVYYIVSGNSDFHCIDYSHIYCT